MPQIYFLGGLPINNNLGNLDINSIGNMSNSQNLYMSFAGAGGNKPGSPFVVSPARANRHSGQELVMGST
jgi:hypothetical protein